MYIHLQHRMILNKINKGKNKMGKIKQTYCVANGDLEQEISLLKYEIYVANQTIKDMRKLIYDYTDADRIFSDDSISYLKSVGCAITHMKGIQK